ncbi:COG3650 family protein [Cesiribacter sp. SM1]|uniref:COG3650 family protein n=1 Tax=Cesiribacter sp. SM1 TaxID=2861196 RepID=UPI001CD22F7E|nr:hypothetical protein [Cesiribacter sp. SM1]
MKQLLTICMILGVLYSCESGTTSAGRDAADTMAPREATDPVPEPPTLPDSSSEENGMSSSSAKGENEIYYRITGTEPFWSLNIGSAYITYRSMEGDSLSFPYNSPKSAAGRTEEWAQLYQLGDQGWALLRRGNTPCSDGMSDRDYAYTATVWLRGQLLDGCGEKKE